MGTFIGMSESEEAFASDTETVQRECPVVFVPVLTVWTRGRNRAPGPGDAGLTSRSDAQPSTSQWGRMPLKCQLSLFCGQLKG